MLPLGLAIITLELALRICVVSVLIPVSALPLPTKNAALTLPDALTVPATKSSRTKLALPVSTTVVGLAVRLPNNFQRPSVISRNRPL